MLCAHCLLHSSQRRTTPRRHASPPRDCESARGDAGPWRTTLPAYLSREQPPGISLQTLSYGFAPDLDFEFGEAYEHAMRARHLGDRFRAASTFLDERRGTSTPTQRTTQSNR